MHGPTQSEPLSVSRQKGMRTNPASPDMRLRVLCSTLKQQQASIAHRGHYVHYELFEEQIEC